MNGTSEWPIRKPARSGVCMYHLIDLSGSLELFLFVTQQLTRSTTFKCANILGATAPLQTLQHQ